MALPLAGLGWAGLAAKLVLAPWLGAQGQGRSLLPTGKLLRGRATRLRRWGTEIFLFSNHYIVQNSFSKNTGVLF